MRPLIFAACMLLSAGLWDTATALTGQTLDRVRANGAVRCGVSEGSPGFSLQDAAGLYKGFNVDFCRAVAAAALGNPDKVVFTPVSTANRLPILLSGKIDLLMRDTTYTYEREAALGVLFAGIYFYDGGAIMVSRRSGVRHIAELHGATICVGQRTTHETNLEDYFSHRGWTYKPLSAETPAGMTEALSGGQCQALCSDRSELAAIRMLAPGGPQEYDILPEVISKEPLGPVVRQGDEGWFILIKWVLFALIEAEERGVTQANVRTRQNSSTDPGLRRFLDSDGLPEKSLGISPGWVVRVIEAVGNYGEIYERHLGSQSGLKLDRELNRLWTQGGLMYSPPCR